MKYNIILTHFNDLNYFQDYLYALIQKTQQKSGLQKQIRKEITEEILEAGMLYFMYIWFS